MPLVKGQLKLGAVIESLGGSRHLTGEGVKGQYVLCGALIFEKTAFIG